MLWWLICVLGVAQPLSEEYQISSRHKARGDERGKSRLLHDKASSLLVSTLAMHTPIPGNILAKKDMSSPCGTEMMRKERLRATTLSVKLIQLFTAN